MVYSDSQARYFTGCWLTFPGDPDLFTAVSERSALKVSVQRFDLIAAQF